MTPEEMKARLDAADAELAAKLREMGFTETEVQRQLDHAVPPEVRSEEAKQILAREFVKAASQPGALQDAIIDRAVKQGERELAAHKARRRQQWIALAVVVALAGAGAYWYLRPAPASTCMKLVGPLDGIEKVVGFPLRADPSKDYGELCHYTVWAKDTSKIGNPIVMVEDDRAGAYQSWKHELERETFSAHEPLSLAAGEGELFVAGDAPEPTTEQLQADVQKRVGHSRDPMGDALGALPPNHHAVVIKHGELTTKILFERRAFTPAQVKDFVATITKTW